ncbi:hypothetical protein IV203_035151 [Nitzschia inconspicua]|uniref:Leucine-rich repeat-containing N-terminal plant-type domain-containing protein n=1 Tax=Nitzschia inconspicua TaxID=303405 RepID=A0A9K3LDH7_9STRA|nr:hypothetical protein IV203_035151 [Nitzschia inconspicua]
MKVPCVALEILLMSLSILFQSPEVVHGRRHTRRGAFPLPHLDDSLLNHHRRSQEHENESFELLMGKGKSRYSDSPSDYPSQEPSGRSNFPQDPSATAAPTFIPTPAPAVVTIESPSTSSPITSLDPFEDMPMVTIPALPTPAPTFAQPPIREVSDKTNPTSTPSNKLERVSATLVDMLSPFSYDFDSWIFDESSYQFKALLRTTEQQGVDQFSSSKILQYWVLYCLYFSTNGDGNDLDMNTSTTARQPNASPGWKNTEGWESTNLDPCQDKWFGIVCDVQSQVTGVRLQRNGLNGVFPFEIVFLAAAGSYHKEGVGNLRRLEVFSNEDLMRSNSSDLLLESLVGLEVLNYRETKFGQNGPIPKLPYTLQEFDCSYASHTGPIPEESFAGLNVLVFASLDGNDFQSSLPTSLVSLQNIQYLTVRNSSLVGTLFYMENMTSIVEHSADKNPQLSGPLFTFLGNLPNLRSLSASDCSLTGTIPVELAMPNLVQLWLHGNSLQGTIPSVFSNIEELRILTLEDNSLSGTVPFDLCLSTYNNDLSALSVDCDTPVDCSAFFPDCCMCCGRDGCGS